MIPDFVNNDFIRIYKSFNGMLYGLKNKSIAITGGGGFVGCWLASLICFLNKNEDMNINLSVFDRDLSKFCKFFPTWKKEAWLTLVEKDIRHIVEFDEGTTHLIHAAANPSVHFHATNPLGTMDDIVNGTDRVLKSASRLLLIEKFVNLSSSSVYEPAYSAEKLQENSANLSISNRTTQVYAEAKRYAEALCNAWFQEQSCPIVNLRLFTPCGPFQALESPWVLNNLIQDAMLGSVIRLHGSGESVRGLMYGSDLAIWILRVAQDSEPGKVYNVGSNVPMSLGEIAENVRSNFARQLTVKKNTLIPYGRKKEWLIPDTSKITQEFGLKIYTPAETAIRRSIEWYLQQTGASK